MGKNAKTKCWLLPKTDFFSVVFFLLTRGFDNQTTNKLRGWEGWNNESIELHLQTRFAQLEVAAGLELWTEGFRTVEDIYHIMQVRRINAFPPVVSIYGQPVVLSSASVSCYSSFLRKRAFFISRKRPGVRAWLFLVVVLSIILFFLRSLFFRSGAKTVVPGAMEK